MSQSSSEAMAFPELETKVKRLQAKKAEWTQLSLAKKVDLLKQSLDIALPLVDEWLDLATNWKGGNKKVVSSDEMQGGIYSFVRSISVLIGVLTPAASAESQGKPIEVMKPPAVREVNGQKRVQVYPNGLSEGLLFPDLKVEIYLEPGKPATQASEYIVAKQSGTGAVSLVLGAGNVAAIPFMDTLYRMFYANDVVFLKHNPAAEYLLDIVDKVMQPFIQLDYFHHAKGGVNEAKFLLELCDNAHMTGAIQTYDSIMFGSPALSPKEKAASPRLFKKSFTAELGNVTPFVIVPGKYSDAELDYVVQHVVGCVVNNNSFNCVAAKLLVLQKSWPQRDRFLQLLRQELAKVPPKYAWYPGAERRYDAFLKQYSDKVEIVGETERKDKYLPWAFVSDIPAKKGEYALCNEAFCGILCETSIDFQSIPDFLSETVRFCNDDVWGNLGISLFIDPSSSKTFSTEFEKSINDLKYGSIAINFWVGALYGIGVAAWGGYPGNAPEDVQSGIGFAQNLYMLDFPQKTVARAPTMLLLGAKYPWFPSHKDPVTFLKSLVKYEARGGVIGFLGTLWNGMKA